MEDDLHRDLRLLASLVDQFDTLTERIEATPCASQVLTPGFSLDTSELMEEIGAALADRAD